MPVADNDGVAIRYEVDGVDGGAPEEAVVFCGDVGLGAWQFGWQHAAVAGPYAVVTPELRGVGESDAPPGPYTVETLASDVEAVCADAGVRRAHLVGYGLGGMVALSAGLAGSRAASLTVVGTPASGEAYHPAGVWTNPAEPTLLEASLAGLLSDRFRRAQPDVVDRIVAWREAEDADRSTFRAQLAAIEGFDVADRLHELTTPTLVVHGRIDDVCPVTAGESLAAGLPRGESLFVDGAGHLVGVEASAAVNDTLVGWLDEHARDPIE